MCFFLLFFLKKDDNDETKETKLINDDNNENNDNNENSMDTLTNLLKILWNWSVIIVMSILPTVLPFTMYYIAVIISLTLSIIVLFVEYIKYKHELIKIFPKHIDIGLPIINTGLLIWVLISPPPSSWNHRLCINAIVNGCFFIFALITLIIKSPFTIQYAMENVPQEFWTNESFYDTNYTITSVWIVMWGVSATYALCISLYASQSDLNNSNSLINICDIVVPILLLIGAFKFTAEYPKYRRELAQQSREKQILIEQGSVRSTNDV